MTGPVRADGGQALRMFALDRLGITMLPWPLLRRDLAAGALYEVLRGYTPEPLRLHPPRIARAHGTPKVRQFDGIITDSLSGKRL